MKKLTQRRKDAKFLSQTSSQSSPATADFVRSWNEEKRSPIASSCRSLLFYLSTLRVQPDSTQRMFLAPTNRVPFYKVRSTRAKPAAERSANGEESSLSEQRADRTAHTKCAGGPTTSPNEIPLRLCVFAPLRFCLLALDHYLKVRVKFCESLS